MGLNLLEGGAESSRSRSTTAGRTPSSTSAAEPFGQALGDRRELGEGPDLVGAVQSMLAGRLDDEDGPVFGKSEPRDQRRDSGIVLPPAVDEEAPVLEPVQADPRTAASARESGQLLGRGRRTGRPDSRRRLRSPG